MKSHNCVVRYDAKKAAARQSRWQKIAEEAAKQCGRTALTEVAPITDLSALLQANAKDEQTEIVFCYENEDETTVKSCLQAARGKRLILLVGPEGGFTLEEAEKVQAAGGKAVTLGPRILRAETAAVAAITVAQYENGDLGA